jgi:uncharacterized protein
MIAMLHSGPRVLIFLKAPRLGLVKTRLAQTVGESRALAVYRQLVSQQMQRLKSGPSPEIYFTPADAEFDMQQWLGAQHSYQAQVTGNLGQRLAQAIQATFDSGAACVICIGGDCPALGQAQLNAAIAALNNGNDAVFGPTEDGGYYLVGLNAPQPKFFESIAWSSPETLQSSLAVAAKLGLKTQLLDQLYDVDEAVDLTRALAEGHLTDFAD